MEQLGRRRRRQPSGVNRAAAAAAAERRRRRWGLIKQAGLTMVLIPQFQGAGCTELAMRRPSRGLADSPLGRLVVIAVAMCGQSAAACASAASQRTGRASRPSMTAALTEHAD